MKNAKDIFNAFAHKYQEKFMDTGEYMESLEALVSLLHGEGLKILDIGCGPGNMSAAALRLKPSVNVCGIDISSEMLEIATQNIPSGKFLKLNALEIDTLDDTFDAVICAFCLPYLSETEAKEVFKKISKIINPNGALYVSTMVAETYACRAIGPRTGEDLRLETHFHTRKFIKKNLSENGFSGIQEFIKEEQVRDGQKFRDQIFIAKHSVR